MKFTVAMLADLMNAAVASGHGAMSAEEYLAGFDADKITVPSYPIKPVEVKRGLTGFWRHPAFPAGDDIGMTRWLRERGFDFTITLMILPEDKPYSPGDISNCLYTMPQGEKWFLWEINVLSDGTPIAVWIAPVN